MLFPLRLIQKEGGLLRRGNLAFLGCLNIYFFTCSSYRQRRFLVLRKGELLYFDKEQQGDNFSAKPKGVIRLATASVSEVNNTSFLVRSEGMTQVSNFVLPFFRLIVLNVFHFLGLGV